MTDFFLVKLRIICVLLICMILFNLLWIVCLSSADLYDPV